MVFRRKKNNKARRILSRIRKRKASGFKKAVRKIAKKEIMKKCERKLAIMTPVNQPMTTNNTAFKCNNVIVEALCQVEQQSITTDGTAQTLVIDQAQRQGKAIDDAQFRTKLRIEVAQSGMNHSTDATKVQIFYPYTAIRVIVFQPKIFGDNNDASAYMNSLFGGDTSDDKGGETIHSYIDETAVTVLKDSGVRYFQNVDRWGFTFNFSKFYKKLRYFADGDLVPDDRRPLICIVYTSATASMDWFYIVTRQVKFKDP